MSFVISTVSCCDLFKSYMKENNIYCIVMKRILNGVEIGEVYNSDEECENFYAEIKKGALPTTSQINSYEFEEYFEDILKKEPQGDIIHLELSSGLSGTCDNAAAAAKAINKRLSGRKIYVFDTLSASLGIGMMCHQLLEMRQNGLEAEQAIKKLTELRGRQQVWVALNNLFHLCRGGRISGFKAAVGTLMKLKPIMIINKSGHLSIENRANGTKKAVRYILDCMNTYGARADANFCSSTVYVLHSSESEGFVQLSEAIAKNFPGVKIITGMIGPVIGTHVGGGAFGIAFFGAPRLD